MPLALKCSSESRMTGQFDKLYTNYSKLNRDSLSVPSTAHANELFGKLLVMQIRRGNFANDQPFL